MFIEDLAGASNIATRSNLLLLQRLGAVGDVKAAVVGLEQLCADLERMRLLQRRTDLLDVRLAWDVEKVLLNLCHLAVDDLVWHLAAVSCQLTWGRKAQK
eukprot:6209002-Pleurochrysis_carterae.AAC.1